MTIVNVVAYGILAPIPLWIFLYVMHLWIMNVKHGIMCKKCKQRHYGYKCPPPKEEESILVSGCALSIVLFFIGAIIVLIVQFMPY